VSGPYRIGVIRGDGIGPEVVREALKVLERAASIHDFAYDLIEYPWSSTYYLETGRLMTEADLGDLRTLDAIFLGALGDPRVERGLLERSVIMTIRFGLDLYINLRPVVLYAEHLTPLKGVRPQDVDMAIIRENTEDVYVGIGGTMRRGTPQEIAVAEMIYTWAGVERTVRYAFELARRRDKKRRLTLVDKANAIRPHEIWRRALEEVGEEFPDVEREALYVDAAAMLLVSDPARFDVMVTTNLFGDILTDLGAAIQGGMGGAASANLHPGGVSMFEPIHGSAPDIAGKGIASPVAAIAAMAMMLDELGERKAAASIDGAITRLLMSGRVPALDAGSGLSTEATGTLIADELARTADH
jgi:3-isopropylmalate dehydrogenase